jgi:tRNA(Arg) A34 adenosine deaminase TadA
MDVDEGLLRQAIALARQAREAGNHPFGALLAVDGRVVMTALNTVHTAKNPTAHAEANLIDRALAALPIETVRRGVLYSSCEPCAMCTGKIYWAGIRSVVYALATEELAAMAGGEFVVPCRELFARAADRVEVAGPFPFPEAREVHAGYWQRESGVR